MIKIDVLPGIVLYRQALLDADSLFADTLAELSGLLTQQSIVIRGRSIPMPRKTAWVGDPDAVYLYSGINNIPSPWTPTLQGLRERLNKRLQTQLNSVLCNYYENGSHSIGWHADNEAGLTDRIVSVSLGVTRTFLLREGRHANPPMELLLHNGDILTMTVESQRLYQHSVPKEPHITQPRLNLTFRTVQ